MALATKSNFGKHQTLSSVQNVSVNKMSNRKNEIQSQKWDPGGDLPEAGCRKTNENPVPTPVRACSVEPVKMCFVLRGSHCPHKHTRTGFFPPWVCGVSVLSHFGRGRAGAHFQQPHKMWFTWGKDLNRGWKVIRGKTLLRKIARWWIFSGHLLSLFFCPFKYMQTCKWGYGSERGVGGGGGGKLLPSLIVDRGSRKGAYVCFGLLDCCLHVLNNNDLYNLFDEVSWSLFYV